MNRRVYQTTNDSPLDAGSGDPAHNAVVSTSDIVGRVPTRGGDSAATTDKTDRPRDAVGPGAGDAGLRDAGPRTAGSGDPAHNAMVPTSDVVGRVPTRGGDSATTTDKTDGLRNAGSRNAGPLDAGSGDPAHNAMVPASDVVGRVPTRGGDSATLDPSDRPCRLRRLHRVWPDRNGNISYLITLCVDGRARVLDNEIVFERFISFLLDSPRRYDWFPRRFVVMPDHVHVIAHQGRESVRLGQWIKAMKAVVGGLVRRETKEANAVTGDAVGAGSRTAGLQNTGLRGIGLRNAGSGDPAHNAMVSASDVVGRVPTRGENSASTADKTAGLRNAGSGDPAYSASVSTSDVVGRLPSAGAVLPSGDHLFTREKRSWRWQEGFHDHKFRTRESEQRKWEYICLNPVRYGLVARPEQWPFGGEIFHEDSQGPQIVRGTPPLLEVGVLIEKDDEK